MTDWSVYLPKDALLPSHGEQKMDWLGLETPWQAATNCS